MDERGATLNDLSYHQARNRSVPARGAYVSEPGTMFSRAGIPGLSLITAVDLACPDDMVPADMSLEDLLGRFGDRDVGSLVVVESAESRRVVGLVEQRDLLRVLHGEATAAI